MESNKDYSSVMSSNDNIVTKEMELRQMTFGEKLVGLTFNPSGNAKVNRAKELCAELADLLNDENNQRETSQFSQRLFSHAVCEILNAQMNVVKVLTLQY